MAEPASEKTVVKERTPPRPARAPLQYGVYYHTLAFVLSVVVFLLITFAWISTASISLQTPGGRLASTPRLLHINQTMESNIGLDGSAESKTLRRWGFGAFGFCEWNFNKVDMMQPGECVKQIGWMLPSSAEEKSDILAIDMPVAIGKVLSIMSLLLGITVLSSFVYAIGLAIAFARTPLRGESEGKKRKLVIADTTDTGKKYRRQYDLVRGWKGRLILYNSAVDAIIILIVVGAGVVEVNSNKTQKLHAELGSGGYMLVMVVVLVPIIDCLTFFGGLRVK